MIQRPPSATRTDKHFPYTSRVRSGELKASQRKIHVRMTREGHDHFGVAIPGGGFFLLLFVCFIIHIRVPFFRLKSRERSVQSLRSFPSPSHFKKSPFPSLLFPGKGESGAYQ